MHTKVKIVGQVATVQKELEGRTGAGPIVEEVVLA